MYCNYFLLAGDRGSENRTCAKKNKIDTLIGTITFWAIPLMNVLFCRFFIGIFRSEIINFVSFSLFHICIILKNLLGLGYSISIWKRCSRERFNSMTILSIYFNNFLQPNNELVYMLSSSLIIFFKSCVISF